MIPILRFAWCVPPALALVLLGGTETASAQSQSEWNKRVENGDTLIGIARRFLREPLRWRELQKFNAVRNADLLSPGSTLRIPVQWMRGEPATAVVLRVQGDASVSPDIAAPPSPAKAGDTLPVGSRLRTGSDSAMSLRFADGSQVLITPQTEVTLEQMLSFPDTGGFSTTRLKLDRGAVESQVPPSREVQRSYEISTPVVTLGVRGTQFRATAVAESGDSRLEVVNGSVRATASRSAEVGAGLGVVTAADGRLGDVETLLPAPELGAPPTMDAQGTARMQWEPVSGATGYRAQVLAATGGDILLRDAQWPRAQAQWPGLAPGSYRLRVRAIAASGLEGQNADAVVELAAFVAPPLPGPPAPLSALPEDEQRVSAQAAALSWYGPSPGLRYRLQVAASADFAAPIFDQMTLEPSPNILVQAQVKLLPGRYHWRVASVGPQGVVGPFGTVRSFELAQPAP